MKMNKLQNFLEQISLDQKPERAIATNLNPIPLDTPLNDGKVIYNTFNIRVVCISDTHSRTKHMKYPVPLKADILIHAGDFTMYGDDKEVKEFNDYLGTLTDIKYKVVIAGNHEPSLDKKFATDEEILKTRSLLKNCIYLQDSSVMLFGLKIYGSPWQPRHAGNGFQAKHSQMKDIWKNIPDDTDILVTHGPPHGFGDKCGIDRHVGCVSLYRDVSLRVKPKYHIFGHIHEGYGMWSNGETTFINAAICNRGYKPDRPPIIFDIDPVKDN